MKQLIRFATWISAALWVSSAYAGEPKLWLEPRVQTLPAQAERRSRKGSEGEVGLA